jgi:hypothetical protein
MLRKLQDVSRDLLCASDAMLTDHPIWTAGGWRGFLDDPRRVKRAINYVQANPIKSRIACQVWPFVAEYDDWPFHKRSKSVEL